MKESLKQWNYSSFGSIEKNIKDARREIQELDLIDDTFGLEELEIIRRSQVTTELFKGLNLRNGLRAQKARANWIRQGDINSSFFHMVMNQRRKSNEIAGIQIGNDWVEEVADVKKGIRDFFQSHFSKPWI